MEAAPLDCIWHLIGTLQRNKVRKALAHFALIHSVDTPQLAQTLSLAAQEMQLTCSILLQVNCSGETSKHGLSPEQWLSGFDMVTSLPHLQIKGLMTMAPLSEDHALIRHCFSTLRHFRNTLSSLSGNKHQIKELSMGMSHDFQLAIEEGATLLRIGTALWS